MTDEQEESTRRPTSECRGRGGGAHGTGEGPGGCRISTHCDVWGEVFIRVGLVDGKGWVCRERGEQYGVATMSRPDQWLGLFWEKEPYTSKALSKERAGHLK